MDGDTTFGAWLKRRRRQLDLTQKRLSHQVGCSVGTIRKMEADERRPSQQLARLLVKSLEIPPDQHDVFIAFSRSEPYISNSPLPVLAQDENQIPIIPQEDIVKPIKHNLPLRSTPFVGREEELAALDDLFAYQEGRLVTIVGPGGIGKTRLGIAWAERQLAHKDGSETHPYKDGIVFVNLAPLPDAERLIFNLAEALNLRIQGGPRHKLSPKGQLLDYLRDRLLLLVLDNFEHLLSPPHLPETEIAADGAALIAELLGTAPEVRILVTSRERLNLYGEQILAIDGLPFPDWETAAPGTDVEGVGEYTAVQLFLEAAQRSQQNFSLESDGERLALVRICQLVGGMPLALELSASWVDTLSLEDIAAELKRDLDLLETELRDVPPRQRSVRATFETSWRKLDERGQSIFAQLSIFRGGFTRPAVQAVTGATPRQLSRLVSKSLIQFDKGRDRYQVHELLRQYGAERLARDSQLERNVYDRHSTYYCQVLAGWERDLQGSRQASAVQEMVLEIDNILAAWARAVEKVTLKLLMGGINGLCFFYDINHQRLEGETICRSLVERLDGISASDILEPGSQEDARTAQIDRLILLARALAWCGFFNMTLGNVDRSHKLLQKCLSTLDRGELVEQDTRFEKAVAYTALPAVMKNVPHTETEQLAKEAVELFRSQDEPWWVGHALNALGFHNFPIGDEEWYFEESFATQRKLGNLRGMANSLIYRSYMPARHFQFEKAEEMLYEALAISTELDDRHQLVEAYGTLGWQWVWQGRFDEARSLYRETLATYSDLEYSQSYAAMIYAHLGYPDQYLGAYEAARSQAQNAFELLREVKTNYAGLWIAYTIDILGKVALAEGSYAEAEKHFQECLSVFQSYDHPEKINTTLTCLGYIARKITQISQSQIYFFQALRGAVEVEDYLPLIHALPGIALLFADQGDGERAVELYTLASTMGIVSNSRWFADIAGDEIAAVAASLPDEVVEAAKGRVRAAISWEAAAELLVELENLGWRQC